MRPSDSAFVGKAIGVDPYLVGDFEDWMTELGKRVLLADLDHNDWHLSPWPEPEPAEQTCPRCYGTGKVRLPPALAPRNEYYPTTATRS
jgi:hypothetical protein